MAGGRNNGDRSALAMFAGELRAARARVGLTRDELGERINYSGSLVSLVETMARVPTLSFAQCLDAALETPGTFERMQKHLRAVPFPSWFRDWPDIEANALVLRSFELVVVPGLLQTEDYARALLANRIASSTDDAEEIVNARMERQAILARDKPPELWVVLDEAVLHRPVGGPYVMREQLNHLAGMARRSNIVIEVIPASTGVHEGLPGAGFTIADFADAPGVAYQDTAVRGQVIDDSDDIAILLATWDRLRAEALPRGASLQLIEEVAKTWT